MKTVTNTSSNPRYVDGKRVGPGESVEVADNVDVPKRHHFDVEEANDKDNKNDEDGD